MALLAAPRFRCSDPYLERYFEYRWRILRRGMTNLAVPVRLHSRALRGASAAAIAEVEPPPRAMAGGLPSSARERRWLHDPAPAHECIAGVLEAQNADGGIRSLLTAESPPADPETSAATFADWPGAVQDVLTLHPDRRFLNYCHERLKRHADCLDRPCGRARIRRTMNVAAAVAAYRLYRVLEWTAAKLERADEVRRWGARAESAAAAVRGRMWNRELAGFCDFAPRSGRQLPLKTLAGFYPFLSDLATHEHLPAIRRHLLNPDEFWTPWPAPAIAVDQARADPRRRRGETGESASVGRRTWLATNSLIADALARAALTLDPSLEPYAVAFITRFVYLLFADRDLDRPTSFEQYDSFTGQPAAAAVDGCTHGYLNDLVIRYVVGLRPLVDGRIVVAPLQFGLRHFSLENCLVAGRPVSVRWDGRHLEACVGRDRQRRSGWGVIAFESPG